MTLTVVFSAIFGVGLMGALTGKGRRPLLVGIAIAVPFYDSAFIASGPVVVSPYYAGLILYLGLVALAPSGSRAAKDPRRTLLMMLWAWAVFVTLLAPTVFAGTGVYSSASGLDEQAGGNLAELDYTSSNVAQVLYLTLNVMFILAAVRTRDLGPWFIRIALIVGVVVAGAIYFAGLNGTSTVTSIFDNSPRNSYAGISDRIRAQFAEPSHLGAFSLTAFVYFAIASVAPVGATGRRSVSVLLSAVSLVLMFGSVSGTAFVGAGLTLAVVFVLFIPRLLTLRVRLPAELVILLHVAAVGAILASGWAWTYFQGIVEEKVRTQSAENRSSSNSRAREIVSETWGMGVGLGSNRASSMLYLLASTIGVVGLALFVLLALRTTRTALEIPAFVAAGMALVAEICSAFVSIANFASPVLWGLIATCFMAVRRPPEEPEPVTTRTTAEHLGRQRRQP